MALPLRRQVFLLNVVVLVPIFVTVYWAARETYREQVRQLADETQSMAVTVVAYLNRSLTAADATAGALSLHPAVQGLDAEAIRRLLPPLVGGPLLTNIAVTDPAGRMVTWVQPVDDHIQGQLPADFFGQVGSSGQRRVSGLLTSEGERQHSLIFAYPAYGPGRTVAAVIGLEIHLEAVQSVLASIPLPEGSVVTVTDDRSVVLARSRDSERYVGKPIETGSRVRPFAEVPVSVTRTGVDGIERVFGNHIVERGPWLVSVGIPTSVAWARTAPIYQRNLGIFGGIVLLAIVLQIIIVRRFARALDHVERSATRVAGGDLTTPDPYRMPSRELDRLQQAFADMVVKLRQAREAIDAQVAEERRAREEIQSLQRQVVRQERLAAIGVLVSGVAHELNNPLQAILGFSELLQMTHDLPESAKTDLGLIQKESARASGIIRNLSRFGRQSNAEPGLVRLRDIVASVVELRQRKLEQDNITLVAEEHAEQPVRAIFTELQQVLLNFVLNAEQALVADGAGPRRIVIRTLDADGQVRLEVEDSGPGVAPEAEANLFQPFFTTKPVGEGTGLGLSVSYGIIQAHGGTIGHRRAPSGGAIFFFELPAAAAAAEPPA